MRTIDSRTITLNKDKIKTTSDQSTQEMTTIINTKIKGEVITADQSSKKISSKEVQIEAEAETERETLTRVIIWMIYQIWEKILLRLRP